MHAKRRNAPSSAESQRGVGEWRTELNASPSEFRALSDAANRPVALSPARVSGSPTDDLGDGGVGEVLNFSQTTLAEGAEHVARTKRPLSRPTPTHASPPPAVTQHHAELGAGSGRASSSATPRAQGGGRQSNDGSGRATAQSLKCTSAASHASRRTSDGDRSGSCSSDASGSTDGQLTRRSSQPAHATDERSKKPVDQIAPLASSRLAPIASTVVAVVSQDNQSNTFQKQGLRHARQNWKAAHATDNALCLPKPDPQVHAVLSRMLGRKLMPLQQQPAPNGNKKQPRGGGGGMPAGPSDAKEGLPPNAAGSGVGPSPQLADSHGLGGHAGEAVQGRQNSSGAHGDQHCLGRGKSSTDNRSLVTTPNVFFSRSETPTNSVVQTSIIPSHAHPPEVTRPPSQLALSELLLGSPPSTASQLLSRNLLGLTIGDSEGSNSMSFLASSVAPDRRLAAAMGSHHVAATGSGGGFSASASVIGSLRPNSVMRLPPIVSTSMADARQPREGLECAGNGGAERAGKPPRGRLPQPQQQHRTVEWTTKHSKGGSVVTEQGNATTLSPTEGGDAFVGDPEEVLLGGGGMFAVLTPGQSSLPTATFQTLDAPIGVAPLVVQGVHQSAPTSKDDRGNARHQPPASGVGSLTHNSRTPQHLLTFGLRDAGCYQDGGEPLELDLAVGAQATTGRRGCGGAGSVGKLRLPHQQSRHSVSPDGARSPSLCGSVVASSLKHREAQCSTHNRMDDPLQRVAEVCAWGYDLRSLFLVQLARDALTLPRFLSTHATASAASTPLPSLEMWVLWLQLGGSKEADAAEALRRRPGHSDNKAINEKHIREMARVISIASAYVGATFLRGRNAAVTRHNKAHGNDLERTAVLSPSLGEAASPLPSLDRSEVRKLLVDQGLQIADVCHMFKDGALSGISTSEAQRIIKGWLLDPAFHHPQVESCMAQLVSEAGSLRDALMDCLRWNREEREAFEYFASVAGRAASSLANQNLQDASVDAAEASTATMHRRLRLMEDDLLFVSHMEAALDAYNRKWRDAVSSGGSSRGGGGEDRRGAGPDDTPAPVALQPSPSLPETVESFCATQYLSLADVCAWLARSQTFDRTIMRHIWAFVVAHQANRHRRMRPLTKLQALQRALDAANPEHTGAHATAGAAADADHRLRTIAELQAVSQATVVAQEAARSTRRIPQDQFVLETVIGKLRLQDAEDRHNAVLHGGVSASLLLQTKVRPTGGGGPDGQVGWRALARNQAAHQEMLFRQEAELLRHVVKRRAEPHHRTNLQRVQAQWRAKDMAVAHRPHAVVACPEEHAVVPVDCNGSMGVEVVPLYKPVCQETLGSFLSIQSLATERLPPWLVSYLKECLSA